MSSGRANPGGTGRGQESGEPTIGSRVVFRGRIATVRVDEVRLPSGRAATREIIEHPGAAAVVAVTDDDHVVMVRQYRKATESAMLEIPAGTLEPGEGAPTCAERELAEETGLRADTLTPLVTYYPSPGILTEAITIFLARGLHPKAAQADASEEGLRAERVPLERIAGLIDAGEIRDGKSLVGLLLATRVLERERQAGRPEDTAGQLAGGAGKSDGTP